MDAERHGRDQLFENPAAHPAAHQSPQAAFLRPDEAEHQLVELAAQRRPEPDDLDHVSRQWRAGNSEDAGAGQRIGPALRSLEPRALRIRTGDIGPKTELAGEVGHGVVPGREALSAGIKDQASHRVAGDLAAEVIGGLEQGHFEAAQHEIAGHHKPGDPPTDHDRARHGRQKARARAARCA